MLEIDIVKAHINMDTWITMQACGFNNYIKISIRTEIAQCPPSSENLWIGQAQNFHRFRY